MKLTFEETQGTRTFYLPLDRDSTTPPELAVVIKPGKDHQFRAGVSFCSPGDQFSKSRGRLKAFGRMKSRRALVGSAREIVEMIIDQLQTLADRHGDDYADGFLMADVGKVLNQDSLEAYFQTKKENREDQEAKTAVE
jgi:hypothetical protein